jgi:phosphate transport system substrate-binding protein
MAATAVAGCFGAPPEETPQEVTLNGAGATFPAPLYDQWQATYTTSVNTHVHINYNAVGSGAGITQITANQVDFAGSDAPMNPTEFAAAPGILHIPSTLGAVIPIYNIPSVGSGLNFTAQVLAQVFNGNITAWNDTALVALNPGLAGVNHEITPVHRSDGSGTSFVFTSYLHKVAPADWPESGSKNWPNNVGIGGNGNAGVASGVDQNTYSIGYVELSYAKSNPNLNQGKVANKDGYFVAANETTTAAAAAGISGLPAGDASWNGVDILNQPGANAYPIASMTYLLVYKTQSDKAKGQALANFIWWAIHNDAQQYAGGLGYAALPVSVIYHNENTTDLIKDGDGNKLRSVTGLGYPPAGGGGGGGGGGAVTLDGAGATFPAPLYDVWQGTYTAANPDVHINYGGGGSGAGITQITAHQVDWAGSDAPMNSVEFGKAPGVLHIPSTLGAVIPVYKIPNVGDGLNFTAQTLANIFNGNITTWDDPALVADNPGLAGLSNTITVVHRSDGSGTTFVFTSYLYKAAPDNWTTPGHKNWPNTVGIGGSGNAGVSSSVQQNDYSIGYVELSYAQSAGSALNYGRVKSHDGAFLEASAASTAAAAGGLSTLPAGDASWEGVEILDQPGANAYPIASMTYILVYKTQTDHAKGVALVNFLWWAVHDGQSYCEDNGYAPLPASVVTHNEMTINSIVDVSGNHLHM